MGAAAGSAGGCPGTWLCGEGGGQEPPLPGRGRWWRCCPRVNEGVLAEDQLLPTRVRGCQTRGVAPELPSPPLRMG